MGKLFEAVGNNTWRVKESRKVKNCMQRLYDAEDMLNDGLVEKSMEKFRGMIHDVPDIIDAYNSLYLCHHYLGNEVEALAVLESGMNNFLPQLPQPLLEDEEELLWGFLENRPFMRLCANLGLEYLNRGKYKAAKKWFDHLLAWNSDDNQGIRENILICNIELGFLDESFDICKSYPEDMMAATVYGRPLLLLMLGKPNEARKFLISAIEHLPKVAKELLTSKHKQPKSLNEGYISIGGDDQAYIYWENYGEYWKKAQGAMLLLKELFASTPKRLNVDTDDGEEDDQKVKVGRNESCPCGSGKKYKKCCGDNF